MMVKANNGELKSNKTYESLWVRDRIPIISLTIVWREMGEGEERGEGRYSGLLPSRACPRWNIDWRMLTLISVAYFNLWRHLSDVSSVRLYLA